MFFFRQQIVWRTVVVQIFFFFYPPFSQETKDTLCKGALAEGLQWSKCCAISNRISLEMVMLEFNGKEKYKTTETILG